MGPVSRGRKPKRKGPGGRSPRSEADLLVRGLLRDAERELADTTDALHAELCVSALLGSWWKERVAGGDPDVVLGERLVDQAARSRTPEALGLLRCVAELGTPAQRRKAARAAEVLAGKRVADPPWELSDCAVTGCWEYGDVYGDGSSILLAFTRDGTSHGLVVGLDHTLAGMAEDAYLVDDPAQTLDEVRMITDDPLEWLRPITPARARAVLEPAFAATDAQDEPLVDDGFADARALALARLRALPEPDAPPAPRPTVPAAERERLVAEFLAAPHAAELGAGAGACVRLVVDHGCDHDGGRPLRVSPGKAEDLHAHLLDGVGPFDPCWELLPDVYPAWIRWAGERSGLTAAAIEALVAVAGDLATFEDDDPFDELLDDDFPGDDPDGPPPALVRAVLEDLVDEDATPEAVQDAVLRRMFTMPFTTARIGDEEFTDLNPGNEDDRGLLIRSEHPEYHDMLDDPFSEALVDGVNPRLHLAFHEMVANQLWAGDPPEAWAAAQRLLASGMDRHDVLHALAEVSTRHLHGALTEQRPVDVGALRADLDALGAPAPRRRGRRPQDRRSAEPERRAPRLHAGAFISADARDAGTGYQLTVTLRHVEPPIWRRLVVPGAITLDRLHDVLQVVMGWEDDHPHGFSTARGGSRGRLRRVCDPVEDEAATRLDSVLARPGDRLTYTYDLGDNWEHDVELEQAGVGTGAAECLAGERACPPQDCGGPWGYAALLAAGEWAGELEPERFDRDRVNRALTHVDVG